ncbi:uncharacterized protein ColSpa_03222 [Colletotrichum spaethianum]|uniref:Uncharacterized protein n=1 Tax=Colletotrichum spaethianum TaxID=700344 RepID=A0AA37P572_9PEZI|nr:uncharacterized protein ColSpa_03222 [Colletotrichum spaethianum]GKT43041.1 hypothetical protein ColSpa_03222 [Colletotrichum spaethianum]
MGPSVKLASKPTPPDYEGSALEKVYNVMAASFTEGFPADGDHLKAAQVTYEVVMGTAVGQGREAEGMLPLGRDMAKRVYDVVEVWQKTMKVFGDTCNSVFLEK